MIFIRGENVESLLIWNNSAATQTGSAAFIKAALFYKKDSIFPVLPLPKDFWNGGFVNMRFEHSPTEKTFVPALDPIISEYGEKLMPILFTVKFIENVEKNFSTYGFNFKEKLVFALQFYRDLYKPAIIEIIGESVSETISYYLENPSNLTILKSSAPNKQSFVTKIQQVYYPNRNRKINASEAEGFIEFANKKIEEAITKFFSGGNPSQLQKDKSKENEASPYYTIDAGIVLEADAIAVLDKIGPLYFEKAGKKFNVNSGTRDSGRQAEAMYTVYMSGDKTLHLYKNRQVIGELLAIIKNGQKTGKTKDTIVGEMKDVIQKYFEKGVFLSGHQRAGAIDIDINGDVGIDVMSKSEINLMMQIAKKITGRNALLEKSPPHLHIQFK